MISLIFALQLSVTPEAFPAHPSLESAISFWTLIFTELKSDEALIHDRAHMGNIWARVALVKNKDKSIDESATRAKLRAEVEKLKDMLKAIVERGHPDSPAEALLLSKANWDFQTLVGAEGRVRWQRGVADNFSAGLIRRERYIKNINKILDEEGVPSEIAALPFVESMFNPKARSSAGAAGLWQLMPATARGLGLRVKAGGDERMNVLKATRAAAKMLRQNFRMLKTWPLAITGYNHGPNGVRRAVAKVGSSDLVDLIENYKKGSFGFASKNFYAEFIAVNRILRGLEADGKLAHNAASTTVSSP